MGPAQEVDSEEFFLDSDRALGVSDGYLHHSLTTIASFSLFLFSLPLPPLSRFAPFHIRLPLLSHFPLLSSLFLHSFLPLYLCFPLLVSRLLSLLYLPLCSPPRRHLGL
ncbi:hypothetical protein H112_08209 [Trichophyton rubrum D6]|uniref:Transmembrane protein n=3 Tax=Trichophyton TaxID=5550 RepID=A0A080WK65_TRIRC|nr:uncharacterized protein TERG_11629 [Trichophyton rubrum CBS 118892]EZF10550.1 hypothetical protein H100_08232 [Trichophyton rubrum MR850]EZF37420.1 hypothetical protein H102_08189 [Trichophyton rubrum CBS 100081]EZF48117.1 hypothetical protein H103_08214 [Trichophyton rubrum CBS 288.86]EZF58715.1 hypothetical protein H104_08165 [Trichophyton rubrum CBS 289.86]EZF69374.1 hypothetical protein H105_08217 [Trichophyton soudanense CBS 452.61]EZF79997.1 hypothetical protein H110_08211 [Trichophy